MFVKNVIIFSMLTFVSCRTGSSTDANNFSQQKDNPLNIPTISTKTEIYVDAGSSGARLGIYQIEEDSHSDIHVKEVSFQATKNGQGVHTLHNQVKALHAYFEPLMQFAEKQIGKEELAKTPIHIYATGGMRSLSKVHQGELVKDIEAYLQDQKKFKHFEVKVLTGEEEGVFGWLAVNYLMNNFSKSHGHPETVGVVDVGGATLQIVFEVKNRETPHPHTLNFKMGGEPHQVYVHSYNYGQNFVFKNNEYLHRICTEQAYNEKNPIKTRYEKCFHSVQNIFKKTCKHINECGLSNTYQPKIEGSFLGLGGIVYLSKVLAVEKFSEKYLKETGQEVCSHTEAELKKQYTQFVDDYSAFCFRMAYSRAILFGNQDTEPEQNGLGFSKDKDFNVPATINGHKSFSWAIGAVYFNARGGTW